MPSLGYGLVYLLVIPIFALIYYNLPGHFYHGTIQYEYTVPHKFESIQKGLSALIIDRFNHQYSEGEDATYEATVDGWIVNPVRLDNLMIGDKGVSFELFVDAWNEKETNAYKSNTTSRFPLRITFDLTDDKLKAKTFSVPSETND